MRLPPPFYHPLNLAVQLTVGMTMRLYLTANQRKTQRSECVPPFHSLVGRVSPASIVLQPIRGRARGMIVHPAPSLVEKVTPASIVLVRNQ
mmetsp:Transcript_26023/g.67114  ORF Transcript_26023/g.67114 Transcript_26023/m.67114 type:complete len:91 (+) Transcript_26023:420-692(+)